MDSALPAVAQRLELESVPRLLQALDTGAIPDRSASRA